MPLFLCNTEQQKLPVHKPDVSDLSQKTLTGLAGVLALGSDENQQDANQELPSCPNLEIVVWTLCFGS